MGNLFRRDQLLQDFSAEALSGARCPVKLSCVRIDPLKRSGAVIRVAVGVGREVVRTAVSSTLVMLRGVVLCFARCSTLR
jgi:hypothetical protein